MSPELLCPTDEIISNKADLQILGEMGLPPKRREPVKKRRIRAVVYMVIAGVRMRKMQMEWAVNIKLQETLAKKFEQARRRSRKSIGS